VSRLIGGMRQQFATPDQIVARIAARQHGIITFQQLLSVRLTPNAIARRVTAGRLHRLYRGVYAVGHTDLSREGRWLAAVGACGEGAVLSHQSAAALWGISPEEPDTVHVTVPGSNGRSKRRGIRLHYSRTLTPAEVTQRSNIPVTTSARTRRDLGPGRPSLCRRGARRGTEGRGFVRPSAPGQEAMTTTARRELLPHTRNKSRHGSERPAYCRRSASRCPSSALADDHLVAIGVEHPPHALAPRLVGRFLGDGDTPVA
jgi:hypothetical protein